MRRLLIAAALACLASCAAPAFAQTTPPCVVVDAGGNIIPCAPVMPVNPSGVYVAPLQSGGTVVVASNSVCHISTDATTLCKTGAGVLHTLTINSLGTVASTTTIYDNTAGSGTVLAVVNTLAGQTSYLYDVAFATGLTIVTTGTVAPDVTASYR